jgi:hypothetical protein
MTNEERNTLAHVVVDPDAWLSHAVSVHGQETATQHMEAKVARWKDAYEAASALPGYQSRAQREASS